MYRFMELPEWALFYQAILSVWLRITKAKILLHLFLSEVSTQSLLVFSFKSGFLGTPMQSCPVFFHGSVLLYGGVRH